MITLIHGPSELLRAEMLEQVRASISPDPEMAGLNTALLDGRQTGLAEVRLAGDSMPFLTERRLVIVEGFLARLASAAGGRARAGQAGRAAAESGEEVVSETAAARRQGLLDYLERLPESTELVLVEDELVAGGPVLRRLLELQAGGRARVVPCSAPRPGDLPAWIRERAQLRGVTLDATAVHDLVDFVGDDLRLLDQELIKLRDAVGEARAVTRVDVRELVPATRAANVFDMVEALALGNQATAGRLLQHALDSDGEPPLRLMALIARQYRLLIQAKALQAEGLRPAGIAHRAGVSEWQVAKLLKQASHHSFAHLQRALECILAADEAIKTGRLTDREAMDVLLAELVS